MFFPSFIEVSLPSAFPYKDSLVYVIGILAPVVVILLFRVVYEANRSQTYYSKYLGIIHSYLQSGEKTIYYFEKSKEYLSIEKLEEFKGYLNPSSKEAKALDELLSYVNKWYRPVGRLELRYHVFKTKKFDNVTKEKLSKLVGIIYKKAKWVGHD